MPAEKRKMLGFANQAFFLEAEAWKVHESAWCYPLKMTGWKTVSNYWKCSHKDFHERTVF